MKKAAIFDHWGVLVTEAGASAAMINIVTDLKNKGLEIFILSNANNSEAEETEGVTEVFHKIVNKSYYFRDTGLMKPDPRAYQLILEENNLKPEECIYFDDSKKNVAAAQALGIESHLFESSAQAREKLGL